MQTQYWIVEESWGEDWLPVAVYTNRGSARFYQATHFGPRESRIRKFIAA